MAVDKYGFITLPVFKDFQPAFSQLVTVVVQTLTTTFPGPIHSVYVYGSLIDAPAMEGFSNLDLTVIYYREPDADAALKIDVIKSNSSRIIQFLVGLTSIRSCWRR